MSSICQTPSFCRVAGGLAMVAALLLIGSLALSGCEGWTVSSRPDPVNAGPVLIHLGVIENQVAPPRPGLEYPFTERLKEEIALDRRFEMAKEGVGTRVDVTLTVYDQPDLVRNFDNTKSEIAANATVRLRIHEPSGIRVEEVKAYQSYAPALEKDTRRDGHERLWRDLSRRMLDAIYQDAWGAGAE